MYLMQNAYKFILLFPLINLFLAKLLFCERCHLYLRMDVCLGTMFAFHSTTKMPAFRKLTDMYMFMLMASKLLV